MRIHYLQHVPFEGLGSMQALFEKKGHTLTKTRLYKDEALPAHTSFDWLIVMGGPMGVHDTDQHPWLVKEKVFLKKVLATKTKVLGICLGAQLIADVLGARVFPNVHREIGWFNIKPSLQVKDTILANVFKEPVTVFHWHGDTFDIPDRAVPIASSCACQNQGFILENRVVGLQFHLETTPESARLLLDNCFDELDDSEYVQSEEQILSDEQRFVRINTLMKKLLFSVDSEI